MPSHSNQNFQNIPLCSRLVVGCLSIATAAKKSQSGYTLVELAIVLLIVGVVFTGVLQAAAISDNAKVTSDIRKLQAFQVGYLLYKDRFNVMPGEDSSHPGRFLTVLSTDGSAEGLFYDLQQAGIIRQQDTQAGIGSSFKATWGGSSGANYGLIAGENQVCIINIDRDLAEVIELKLDDGDNQHGNIEYTANGSQLCILIS